MKKEMIYVKIKETAEKDNENLFAYGCNGYGWIYKEDYESGRLITMQCEDNLNGARGWSVSKNEIEICEVQKENPYVKK